MDPVAKALPPPTRPFRALGVGLLLALLGLVGALWFFQEALIYPAPHYSAEELQN